MCLGPSVPYVTLHRIVANANTAEDDRGTDGSENGDQVYSTPRSAHKQPNDSTYSFDFVTLLENNTRLQVTCFMIVIIDINFS